jgi:hypothetical protein
MSSGITETKIRVKGENQTGSMFAEIARDAERSARTASRAYSDVELAAQRFGGALLGVRRRLGAAAVAFVGGEQLRQSFLQFAEMDRRIARIGINAGSSRAEMKGFYNDAYQMGRQSRLGTKGIVEGVEAQIRATGQSIQEVKNDWQTLGPIAHGMGADASDVADAWVAMRDKLKITDMSQGFSLLNQSAKDGKFEAKDFARFLGQIAPSLEAIGYTGEEGLSKTAVMFQMVRKDAGNAEQAFTSFRDLIQKMGSREVIGNFKDFSVPINDYLDRAAREGKDQLATLVQVTDETLKFIATRRNTPQANRFIHLPLLYAEQDSQRMMRSLIMGLDQVGKRARDLRRDATPEAMMRDWADVSEDAAAKVQAFSDSWDKLRNSIGAAMHDVGVSAGMGAMADWLSATADKMKDFRETLRDINERPANSLNIFRDIANWFEEKGLDRAMDARRFALEKAVKHIEELNAKIAAHPPGAMRDVWTRTRDYAIQTELAPAQKGIDEIVDHATRMKAGGEQARRDAEEETKRRRAESDKFFADQTMTPERHQQTIESLSRMGLGPSALGPPMPGTSMGPAVDPDRFKAFEDAKPRTPNDLGSSSESTQKQILDQGRRTNSLLQKIAFGSVGGAIGGDEGYSGPSGGGGGGPGPRGGSAGMENRRYGRGGRTPTGRIAPLTGGRGRSFAEHAPRIMERLMREHGLTREQAAGVVGNLAHESAAFTAYEEGAPNKFGTRGAGWAQWTDTPGSPRRQMFEKWARDHNLDPKSPEASERYLFEGDPEFAKAIGAVKGAKTGPEAVRAFHDSFERSAHPDAPDRYNYARRALEGNYGDAGANRSAMEAAAAAARAAGETVTSTYRSPDHPLSRRNPHSAHSQGRAMDLRAGTVEEGVAAMQRQRERFAKQGLVEGRDYKMINEADPSQRSPWATGPHVHVEMTPEGVARSQQAKPDVPRAPSMTVDQPPVQLPDKHTIKIDFDTSDFPRVRERGEGQSRREVNRDMRDARSYALSDVGIA